MLKPLPTGSTAERELVLAVGLAVGVRPEVTEALGEARAAPLQPSRVTEPAVPEAPEPVEVRPEKLAAEELLTRAELM